MQTGVPLWVPLVVAALGLIGVLAGQAISAWREDRRWLRDRERDVDKLEHESRLEWRLQRFEVYKGLVASVDEFSRSMPDARTFPYRYSLERAYRNSEYQGRITDCLSAVEEAVIGIEFVASNDLVVKAADDLVRACDAARYSMFPPPGAPRRRGQEDSPEEVDWAELGEKHEKAREDMDRLRSEFMSKVKHELALVMSRDSTESEN